MMQAISRPEASRAWRDCKSSHFDNQVACEHCCCDHVYIYVDEKLTAEILEQIHHFTLLCAVEVNEQACEGLVGMQA